MQPAESRVAIVEDNAGVRELWTRLLDNAPGLRCVVACSSAEAALREFPIHRPDVILMDINLPGMSGLECTARLGQVLPQARILIVTVYNDPNRIFNALRAGASGYLLKRAGGEELVSAIREVLEGGAPMTGEIARRVIESFRQTPPKHGEMDGLSPREFEVLGCVAQGYSNKEVAEKLDVSVNTVGVHLAKIYSKLHVRSRTEAVVKYLSSTDARPGLPNH